MTNPSLNVALIGGGMYDRLYEHLPQFERRSGVSVTVGFRGTHPELNAHLARFDPLRYDLVCTHTKYAPSQRRFLAPIAGIETTDFLPALLDLASIGGVLYGLPRNVDLRLLHYRSDLLEAPPATWDELVACARAVSRPPACYGLVLTGMESGLFGTFFELIEAAGLRLFPESHAPELTNDAGRWALGMLRNLYASAAVPPEIVSWHYDEVHRFFREGRAAMVCDWPGYYGAYREPTSSVRDRLALARMPAGPTGQIRCYAGAHTFALTRRGADRAEACAARVPDVAGAADGGSAPGRCAGAKISARGPTATGVAGRGGTARSARSVDPDGFDCAAAARAISSHRGRAVARRAGSHDRRDHDRRRTADDSEGDCGERRPCCLRDAWCS